MGNIVGRSRPLNLGPLERDLANDGALFATFDDIFEKEGVLTGYSGAFEELSELRRGENKAPEDIRKLAEECCKAWEKAEQDKERRNILEEVLAGLFSLVSLSGTSTSKTNNSGHLIPRSITSLSAAAKKAAGNIVNMFGTRAKHTKTCSHQVPVNPACKIFWGMVCEALAGNDMDGFSLEKKNFVRCQMADHLSRFRMNLFAFAQPHNEFYDQLTDGFCVMIIPLLTLEEIADWKQGQAYEILFLCSSEEAHEKLGKWKRSDNLNHIKWEDGGDLDRACVVLTAYVKALADSLTAHWDSYFDKVTSDHQEFETKKAHMREAKKLLVEENKHKVEVPQQKNVSMLLRKKLFKIDLGDLYNENEKQLIPDPSLFAFKAAVNWSGRKEDTRLRKLLSGCPPEEGTSDGESFSSGRLSFTELVESAGAFMARHAEKVPTGYEGQPVVSLLGQEVTVTVSDSDNETSISDVSSVDFVG